MMRPGETLGTAGEQKVLGRVLRHLDPVDAAVVGPGDDSAVLHMQGDLVVTTDTMVEGPDFRLEWHTGFELGWKLAVTNLSDVAAMGAVPSALTLALAAPRSTSISLFEEIARGVGAACREFAPGCGVVGGDLGRAPAVVAAVTAMGDMRGISPVLRSGAQPGDTIACAGDLGLAGQGLALMFEHAVDAHGEPSTERLARLREEHPVAVKAQLTPQSPLAAGPAAAASGATSMLDVSDGLARDSARVAGASGVVMQLDSELLTRGFGMQRGAQVSVPEMLFGGEDHGLLATFPAQLEMPPEFTAIGTVGAATNGEAGSVLLDGLPLDPEGWDPYSADSVGRGSSMA